MEPIGGQAIDDAGGFDALYRREFVRAARLAHLLTGSNAAGEDIAQEALWKLQQRLPTIDRPAAYLTTTVVRLARNWHRGRTRQGRRDRVAVPSEFTDADAGQHEELLQLVDQLPFRQRTVLVARYWLDLTEQEIANVLGCRPGTVKSLASRALDTLRKEIR